LSTETTIERRKAVAAKKMRKTKKKEASTNQWDSVGPSVDQRLMKALGHPLRIGILTVLNDRIASPNELSKILEEGLSQVSYHVKVLKDYDMIEMVKTEPRRGAVEHYYKATSEVFLSSGQLKLMPKSAQRKAFGGVLVELGEDMNTSLETGTFDKRPNWVVARDPRMMDSQGREEAEIEAAKFLAAYKEIGVRASKRLRNGESDPVPTTAAVLIFGSARGTKPPTGKKASKS
jgi:DNA-binding transcriptional ArsR family regulator